jgi:hypothetical protein
VEYVRVPVPEELAARVLTYVSWKDAQANTAPPRAEGPDVVDHDDAIARAFARLDDPSGALVAVVAAAALEAEELSIPDAARRAGVSTREALGILMEVNNVIGDEGGLPITFGRKGVDEPTPGEFAWDDWTVAMPDAAARPFADLARAHAPG